LRKNQRIPNEIEVGKRVVSVLIHKVSDNVNETIDADICCDLGWLTAIGWQVYLASVCFLVGTTIQGLIALNDPNYPYLRWHGTLLAIAIVFFTISFNTVFASKLPLIGTHFSYLAPCALI